jgi:hypothetical protein
MTSAGRMSDTYDGSAEPPGQPRRDQQRYHADHDRRGQEREPGSERIEAHDPLHVERVQELEAQPGGEDQDDDRVRAEQPRAAQDAQRNQRIASPALPEQEGEDEQCGGGAEAPGPDSAGGRLAGADDGVDAQREPGRHQHRTSDVDPAAETLARLAGQQADARHQHDRGDRHVDQEDPRPAGRPRDDATGDEPDRGAGRLHEAVDAHRAGLRARLGVDPDDHAEDDRGPERAARALHEAPGDQHLRGAGEAADEAGDGEDADAGEEDPPRADEVTEPAGQ